ncbi:MAG TPA: M64 family metallopeptidase, partial [Bacteroidales bacterium]|nr:M64 family metallopeptidase [Bacteroidales bacterium]
ATRPYNEYRDHINIRAVHSISAESGTDFPHEGIWKRTLMNSRFFTFGSERYLTTDDYHSLMDVAANVPWDQVLVLVNSKEYGGGGIYNHYLVCTSDHSLSDFVFVHELGHSLAGLADGYYTSSTAYESFYDLRLEPWEPNITTLVDFGSKWQDLILDGTPVPTPDKADYARVTGVFEGAGYAEKGIYRPFQDCTMKSASMDNFCPVCLRAIRRMMESYTEKR